jgi:hypothetical protein
MHDIPTRSSLVGETANPQRKYLRIASLELKKSLCCKVREAAMKRAAEMDLKIADLDAEKIRLLAASLASEPDASTLTAGLRPTRALGLPERRGFALKY